MMTKKQLSPKELERMATLALKEHGFTYTGAIRGQVSLSVKAISVPMGGKNRKH